MAHPIQNESDESAHTGFITALVVDEGVQRAAASVVVALVVAAAKRALFSR